MASYGASSSGEYLRILLANKYCAFVMKCTSNIQGYNNFKVAFYNGCIINQVI